MQQNILPDNTLDMSDGVVFYIPQSLCVSPWSHVSTSTTAPSSRQKNNKDKVNTKLQYHKEWSSWIRNF